MKRICIIGGGISGLSIAQMLKDKNEVIVFENDNRPGGLIKCDVVNGGLFHKTGGHIFNAKRKDVHEWFWKLFNKKKDFNFAFRNSWISMSDGKIIPYPIENNIYYFDNGIIRSVIEDFIAITKYEYCEPNNLEDFFLGRFGRTLYKLYFQPYNLKIWRRNLSSIPVTWLDGKFPIPSIEEIIINNISRVEEKSFVHSSFYYPKKGGSQFIADRLAEGLNIKYGSNVTNINKNGQKWHINSTTADIVIFCGNIKDLAQMIGGIIDVSSYEKYIEKLNFHGTTSVFCEINPNPYSWIYMPGNEHESHRIICTGNFSEHNNFNNNMTGTIEFSQYMSKGDILDNLKKIPFSPKYITHCYEEFTYPIQDITTRNFFKTFKETLEKENVFLLGRFAEWEYFNMDDAIGAALDLSKHLINKHSCS